MIFQSTQWHCQLIFSSAWCVFFCLKSYLVGWQWKDCCPLWCLHTISNFSSWQWLWGLPISLFLVWWCFTLHHFWCGLHRRCRGWFCSIFFLIAVILLLMSKICSHTEWLRRSMHTTVSSLISGTRSCLHFWYSAVNKVCTLSWKMRCKLMQCLSAQKTELAKPVSFNWSCLHLFHTNVLVGGNPGSISPLNYG